MSMNKKEQAAYDAALKAVVVARALNWSEPVLPDVPIPKTGETTGFLFNSHNGEVLYARSSSVFHASTWDKFPVRTNSQGARALYSTKLLALKALRHEVEKVCANKLAEIDIQIAKEGSTS